MRELRGVRDHAVVHLGGRDDELSETDLMREIAHLCHNGFGRFRQRGHDEICALVQILIGYIVAGTLLARHRVAAQVMHTAGLADIVHFLRQVGLDAAHIDDDRAWAHARRMVAHPLTDMRRVQVDGALYLHDDYGWASGGFLSDSIVTSMIDSVLLQQQIAELEGELQNVRDIKELERNKNITIVKE